MNARQLEERLLLEGFPPDSFSVDGTWLDDAVILTHKGGEWYVKYFERGVVRNLGHFSSEQDACAAMYTEMRKGWPEELRAKYRQVQRDR